MARYFTSDLHLNSTLINKYANRPIKKALDAGIFLIDNANSVLKKEDLLIHAGDFCLTSPDRHGTEEDIPIDIPPEHWMSQFNSRLILLAGNHDDGHSFETDAKSMTLDLNQNYRNVTVGHYPSTHEFYRYVGNGNRRSCSNGIHIHLCGHVHNNWKYYYDNKANVLNYNVGVDCHNYKPVRDAEITEDLDFLFKYHDFSTYFKMTYKDEIEWKKTIENKLACDRAVRKKIRYQKKGLTEAECLRRKEEALRKKGLLK